MVRVGAAGLRSRKHREDKPFYLGLHFFGPHLPYIVPDHYFDLIDPESRAWPRVVAALAGALSGAPARRQP